jgi:hypothetical protein
LPCAFVISHPRRAALTLTASSDAERETWIRALNAAIMAPTHALLSYKGRQIFDEEDAAAISASQQAIRGFVSEKILRIAATKRAVDERVQRKRAEIRASKAQKKALAQKLIALQAQHTQASAEGVALSLQLTQVQQEARNFEQAQRGFFLLLVTLINEMEEADINRWTSTDGNGNSNCGEDGEDDYIDDDDDDADSNPSRRYGTSATSTKAGSPGSLPRTHRKPYAAVSARYVSPVMRDPAAATAAAVARRGGREKGPTRSAATLENEIIDSGWTPAAPAQPHVPAAFQIPQSSAASGQRSGGSLLHAQLSSSPVRRAQLNASTFTMPRTQLAPVPGSYDHKRTTTIAPSAGGGGGGGAEEEEEASAIDLSNEQLKYVGERVEALLAAPLDGSGGGAMVARARLHSMAGVEGDFAGLGTSLAGDLGTSLALGASVTGGDGVGSLLALSRPDQLELEEVRKAALGMLSANVQLRLEQNLLTHYVDKWIKRKQAIALLRMDS